MTVIYPDLQEKVVLVTGALRGIGREITLNLARQQAHIVINDLRNEAEEECLRKKILSLGGKSSLLSFDVSNYDEANEAISSFLKEGYQISALVNNAGISKDQLMLRLTPEALTQTIDVNLKGAIYVTKALTRNFLRAKDVSVVNISSVVGMMGNVSQVAYAASKAGLIGFTKSLAKEMGGKNVRCNAVCPGFMETAMTASLSDKVKDAYMGQIPLKRMGNPKEVANLVTFLLSSSSSYITGETIKIDGGLYT